MSPYAASHHRVLSDFAQHLLYMSTPSNPPNTHSQQRHTPVCHPWRCEWSLYGRSSGGHLVFFPSQSLKCKHPSCLVLPNEHLVFQSGLLAVTFFFFFIRLGRGAKLFCITYTYTQACLHALSLLFTALNVWQGWREQPVSPHRHINTLWHNYFNKKKGGKKACFGICAHTHTLILTHTEHTPSFPHLALCLVYSKCNGIRRD